MVIVLLVLAWRPGLETALSRFANHTGWCMLALAVLPVALRLTLLPIHPVPVPDLYDEFSHLFVADTLRHFRLANPPHAMQRFFETFFILQQPTYSSIYPIGQGVMLALGKAVFGTPWAGVLLSTAAFCSLCYWMLRGWTTPGMALLGGLLAVFEFGPLNQWTNSYWGGGLSAAAGCLVFGALPRLRERRRFLDGGLLGLGIAIHLLTRPYETVFLCAAVLLYLIPARVRIPVATVLAILPAIGITLLQNKSVTGNWTTLPYSLSQEQYGVPASLTFQARPVPHRPLTREQELDYRMQRGFRSTERDTLTSYLQRLEFRVRYYRFYFYAPLYLALLAFLISIRDYRHGWVVLTLGLFALGTNFFPAFQFHYLAAVVCLFVLMSVEGLRRIGGPAARVIVYLCIAQFAFSYATHATATPARRIAIDRQLAAIPGKLLVFVRYWPQHVFQEEWVWNEADIDASRIVRARDLGDVDNKQLIEYYPGRTVLLLEPDASPPRLTPWVPAPVPDKAEDKKHDDNKRPKLVLEQVQ